MSVPMEGVHIESKISWLDLFPQLWAFRCCCCEAISNIIVYDNIMPVDINELIDMI